jgi:hypothetical protein
LNAERAEIPLRLFIMQRIMAENPRTVRDLFRIIKLRRPRISEEEFINTIRELKDSGTLTLEPPALRINSYPAYLKLQDENAWLYLVALLTLSTFLAIYVMPSVYPLIIFRWIIGSMFVLFLPGYVTIQALFPEGKELDSIERLALTIGLSLAITPLIGLLLNYTPWGIRLDPIVAALSIFTLGIGMAGSFRKYRIARNTGKA